jgi:hypothetical protein
MIASRWNVFCDQNLPLRLTDILHCATFTAVVQIPLVVEQEECGEVLSTDHVWRQCKVPRAEVMFVTIQRENIRPSKKEMNKAVTILKLPEVCS